MIIPRLGYDVRVRKGSHRSDPPDAETPTSDEQPQTPEGTPSESAVAVPEAEVG
jgi:hypothetical protein